MQATTLPRKRLPAAWAVLAVSLALLFVLVSAVALLAWNSYQDAVERSRANVATATQVARHPAVDTPSNLAQYVLFTEHLKHSSRGVYEAVSPIDGEQRIVGYRKVPNAPLVVIASISRDFAMQRLRDQMEKLALFLLPVLAGLALLSVWVIRLLKHDEQMRASLATAVERNNLLMRKIHHRTKNNLQSVASLLKLQPISDEAKAAMTSRIAAMSALHEQAYRSDQFSEVVSNAMKHAFTARDGGTVTVSLRMISADRAELVIADDGPGFMPTGQETGMGSRLVRAFAQQLGNDYAYARENGTRFAIRFPAKRVAGEE